MRPAREPARNNQQTYFLTFTTVKRTPFFRHDRWTDLLLQVIGTYHDRHALHDFVIMPDHIHLLLTPVGPLERTAQLIKGGFSFRAERELAWPAEIWQAGYSDHRLRDAADYEAHRKYILKNLSSLGMEARPGRHSGGARLSLALVPQWLKPLSSECLNGGAEAAPFQSPSAPNGPAEAGPLQSYADTSSVAPRG